jgi:hypothetical protein
MAPECPPAFERGSVDRGAVCRHRDDRAGAAESGDLDVPLPTSTWALWTAVAALWIWMAARGSLPADLRAFPVSVYAFAGLVYGLQGLGMVVVGARHYMGRAWGDQFNYTAIAQLLTDRSYSTPRADVVHQPYLSAAIRFKLDRLGQSVLHGFLATTARGDAKLLFEPVILLSPFLITLAVFALRRRYDLARRARARHGVHRRHAAGRGVDTPRRLSLSGARPPGAADRGAAVDELAELRAMHRLVAAAMLYAAGREHLQRSARRAGRPRGDRAAAAENALELRDAARRAVRESPAAHADSESVVHGERVANFQPAS